jgi:hypothetical protein
LHSSLVGQSMKISLRIDTLAAPAKKTHGAASSSGGGSSSSGGGSGGSSSSGGGSGGSSGGGVGISNWQLLPDIILDWDSGAFVYYMAFQPQPGLQQVEIWLRRALWQHVKNCDI